MTQDTATEKQVEERLFRMVHRWPQVSGYHLNPDPDIVAGIVRALTRSALAYGVPYCPCRDLTGDCEIDRANICPCQHHHREIREDGYCKCVLFVGDDYDPERAYQPKGGSERMMFCAIHSTARGNGLSHTMVRPLAPGQASPPGVQYPLY